MKIYALREDAKNETLELDVLDVIGLRYVDRPVTAATVVSALRASKAKKIHVRINSVGGLVTEAEAIRAALRERAEAGTKVTGTILGLAASAATLIADACDEVAISAGAFFMIHDASAYGTSGRGTVDDHQKTIETLKAVNENIVGMYVAASKRRGKNKSAADFEAAMKRERYFRASEALEWGLVDRVIEDVRVAACADISALSDAPQELRDAYALVTATAATPAPEPTTPAPVPAALPADRGKERKTMKLSAAVLKALGLSEDADQATIEAAILGQAEAPQALSKITLNALGASSEADASQKAQELQKLTTGLLAMTGASTLAGALAKCSEWKIGFENSAKLAARCQELETSVVEAKRDAKIEQLARDGKLPPSLHAWARTQTAEQLEVFAAGMPAFVGKGPTEPTEQVTTLTAEEKDICLKLGISEESYLASKKTQSNGAPAQGV